MPSNSVQLVSKDLVVTVRVPKKENTNLRFNACGMMDEICLHGKHTFCQPEQVIPGRATGHGVGLTTEFVWDELGTEVKEGEWFPKIGVGLLKQVKDYTKYGIFTIYEVDPFDVEFTATENTMTFLSKAKECNGVAADVYTTVEVVDNSITQIITIENKGTRHISMQDYNHNFLAVDGRPFGPAYEWSIPFDGKLEELPDNCRSIVDRSLLPGVMAVKDKVVHWNESMHDKIYRKVAEADDILTLPVYRWTMKNTDTGVSYSETCGFTPSYLVTWGMEHTASAEVYGRWDIAPGKKQTMYRTWRFED